jgi:hypothetical protein
MLWIRQCLIVGKLVWAVGILFKGLPVAAALTHLKVQMKRVHADTKDAALIKCTSWQSLTC